MDNLRSGIIVFLFILAIPSFLFGRSHVDSERSYQDKWCEGKGVSEYVLPDKTRCDCLTDKHAIEFDFGSKFYEAIGQSLYYALQTGKRAGIVLILESPDDYKYWLRLNSTIDYHKLPIDTWKITQ